jgi:acyl-CoA synthetase (AMP-forming)/AMP-acid ligase II
LRRVVDQVRDIARQASSPFGRHAFGAELRAVGQGLLAAVPLAGALARKDFTPWHWLDRWARRSPNSIALSDEHSSLTWDQLHRKAAKWGAVLRSVGVGPGTKIAVVAENSTQLVLTLFAINWAGRAGLLLDARCDKFWLSTALAELKVTAVLVGRGLSFQETALPANCVAYALEEFFETNPTAESELGVRHPGLQADPFAYLVTSGTTGSPKATRVSNMRAVLSGFGIAKMCLALEQHDVIYCVLPLSHATALLTGLCASLIAGCSFVMRQGFRSAGFWSDVERQSATCLIYVGELARYLLAAPSAPGEQTHRLRIAYGNSLALDVWHRFQSRFRIPRVFEFYGATELPLALVNLSERPGSVGRTPFSQFSPWRIVRQDPESGELVRGRDGLCVPCGFGEAGELVLLTRPCSLWRAAASKSDAASSSGHSMTRVARITQRNDEGLRTGDVVVRDEYGHVKFIDRIFEIFRQNSRNVSAAYVARQLLQIDGVSAACVTHIALPHYDGQLGLAIVVPSVNFSLSTLEEGYSRLAEHERPRFLRLATQVRLNRGLKFDQAAYRSEGLDPGIVQDITYVYAMGGFQRITTEVWAALVLGQFRF